jgi:sugar lactone lactonase YvrE
MEVQHICDIGAELGEGPTWVPRDAALWFVDIKGRQLHRYDPASGERRAWSAPELPGFIVPVRGGGFIVGLKSGLHRFEPETGEFVHFADVEPHLTDNRLNDGCVCADGTLWFGSMHDPETKASGALYRLDENGRVVSLDSGYIVTNGPAFSPDERVFYHTDSVQRVIYAFDRPAPGTVSGKRVFARIEEGAGFPDGTTVDAEGCVWIALWGGWGVRRYSPAGELLATVRLPCANVTKIAFAGEDLRTAYATTAWVGLSAAEREAQPLAGDLFAFRTDVPGLPPVEVAVRFSGGHPLIQGID